MYVCFGVAALSVPSLYVSLLLCCASTHTFLCNAAVAAVGGGVLTAVLLLYERVIDSRYIQQYFVHE